MKYNNYTMICDFYELTMANGYFNSKLKNDFVYFDVFFRKIPDNGGFAIFAGLEQVIDYIKNLKFTKDDISYLKSRKIFSEDFLKYLENFKFTGDIYSVKEGTPIFPNEPLMIIKANPIEAQLLETYILQSINHQSLIATKANRIVRAAKGRPVMEFGARRAHGASASIYGARASFIAGVTTTSNTIVDINMGIKAVGTMAHSWIQLFDNEYEAFEEYVKLYKDNPVLLIDTYNVLKSGLVNAIKIFKKYSISSGAVRIDSGDLTYLSVKVREILDSEGLSGIKIVASNSLDEYVINDILAQGAKIDSFGVGERLITSKTDPVFDGVYKVSAIEKGNEIIPKIKVSENEAKITTPHFKKLYRLFDKETNKAIADLITIHDEVLPTDEIEIFDEFYTWKKKLVKNFVAEELLVKIFSNGELVYNSPKLVDINLYCKNEVKRLWDEVKRFENPHTYYVDLSKKLWDVKYKLLDRK